MGCGSEKREGRNKTILVVEDDESMGDLLCDFIEGFYGYNVIWAMDGKIGWDKCRATKPDLVLLDLAMPRMGGFELLRLIRKENLSTPVIIITGHGTVAASTKAFKLGADDFINKPFSIDQIRRSIEECLCRSPLELETHHLKNLASGLAEENEWLKERIEQLKLSEKRKGKPASEEVDKYRAICGAVAHSLKGEFLHIGYSVKELQELANTSPDMQEEYDMIERSVAYSQILLRRLLDYLDMGKPRVEPIDTLELLRKTELLARPRLPSSIELQITIDHSMKERMVSANFEQLMGVLLELIDNAVRVLRERGGSIDLKLEERNGEIAISVEDNGSGIPEEFKEKLLKEQVPSKSGLGLGLFLCNKVVSTLGGKLNLQTASGKGTTFTILLPMAHDKKEP